jgi:hypothetical protein
MKSLPKTLIYIVAILSLLLPNISIAANVAFDAPQLLGTNTPISVVLTVTAVEPINTLSLAIKIPEGLEFIDASDGNSIINFWVDKPNFDKSTRMLTFSGIIPGGYSGKNGKLLLIHLQAIREGQFTLTYDTKQSKIYLNTPNASPDVIKTQPLILTAKAGVKNNTLESIDSTAPESFTVDIIQNNQDFENKWVAVFAAQDKGSGLSHYELAENYRKISDYDSLKWQIVESPYVLQDQKLESFVYVKAVDIKGNARIEIHEPFHPAPWYVINLRYIIVCITLIILVILFLVRGKIVRVIFRREVS